MNVKNHSFVWKSFDMHFKKTLQEMLDLQKYNDVTLVCDDLVSINSHKAILSSCSKMFKDIFDSNNFASNVVLYLQGVQSNLLKSIIQDIYSGEILLNNDTVDDYLKAAEYLEINEVILEPIRSSRIDQIKNREEMKENLVDMNKHKSLENEDYQECSECDEILENKEEYEIHLKTVHEESISNFNKRRSLGTKKV